MIYLDSSVALAQLLAEDRRPPGGLWDQTLVTSRLLSYEVWVRIHARGLARSHGQAASDLLSMLSYVELAPPVLERALEPFASPVRTLDALHLATLEFLRRQQLRVTLATYDERLASAAEQMGFVLFDLAG